MIYSMKNLKITVLAAIIVFSLAACASGGKKNSGTFLDGSWNNSTENETFRIFLDGNNWIFYDDNKPVSRGTWATSVTPAAGGSGTITFTISQVDMGKGWLDLSVDYKSIRTCKANYSINSNGNQITLSKKKLAAADPIGLWKKLEGLYIKGGTIKTTSSDSGGTRNKAPAVTNVPANVSAPQPAKQLPKIPAEEKPSIFYVITGSGTSLTASKNGAVVGKSKQAITEVINAIKNDANGANIAIQFGNGGSVLDIGAASARFGSNSGDIWGSIALSGKITSSASPTVSVNSVYITSVADISNTCEPADGSCFAIDNNGTIILNGGRVSANAANSYGIRNRGGTVIINAGNVTPKGVGIYNDSGFGMGGNVFINGGTVQSLSSRAIYNMNGSTVTISGGTVTSSSAETIYNPGGAIKINGGTVTGGNSGHAIWNTNNGKVTITGGTVSMVNNNGIYAAISNNSGCTLTISGGTVLAPNGGKAINNADDGTASITSPEVVIIGKMSGI
jgi:hypothetical protein